MESNVHELLRNCTHFYREISIVCCSSVSSNSTSSAVALLCFCFGTCIVHANAHRPRVSRKHVESHRRGRLRWEMQRRETAREKLGLAYIYLWFTTRTHTLKCTWSSLLRTKWKNQKAWTNTYNFSFWTTNEATSKQYVYNNNRGKESIDRETEQRKPRADCWRRRRRQHRLNCCESGEQRRIRKDH